MISLSPSQAEAQGWKLRQGPDGSPRYVAPDGVVFVRAIIQKPTVRIGHFWLAPFPLRRSPSFVRGEA